MVLEQRSRVGEGIEVEKVLLGKRSRGKMKWYLQERSGKSDGDEVVPAGELRWQ